MSEALTSPTSGTELKNSNITNKSNEIIPNLEGTPLKKDSEDLQTLIDHQSQIQQWLQLVNNKIFEIESSYLEDCVSGNIIRGWDIDGRTLPVHRSRSYVEEKDRLFSFSSYSYWLEKKSGVDTTSTTEKPVNQVTFMKTNSLKQRKQKKRKADYEDWNGNEDY